MSQNGQCATLAPLRGKVALPAIAEQTHEALGDQLANALLPLTVYCDRQEAREDLSDWQADHVAAIRDALAAFANYDTQFEDLLAAYRQRLLAAHAQLTERVLPLEMALVQAGPDWQAVVLRLLNHLYRYEPAVALACQRVAVTPPRPPRSPLNWEAVAFRLLDRLHRHEPPLPGRPLPLIAQCRNLLEAHWKKSNPELSTEKRRLLASITSHSLDTPAA